MTSAYDPRNAYTPQPQDPYIPQNPTPEPQAIIDKADFGPIDVDLDAILGPDLTPEKTFRFHGEIYHVAFDLPVVVAGMLGDGKITDGIWLWLGEDQARRIAPYLGADAFMKLVNSLYGLTLGE